MRRVSKFLIAAAGPLLVTTLVIAVQALPASAASGKLLVTTIDRGGHAVTGQPLTLLNLATNSPDYGERSGHAATVADGRYAVLAGIEQTVNGTTNGTLAATTVTVSGTGTTTITLDARKGHLVRVTLDGQPVSDYTDARVCAGIGPGQLELVENGPMYVVPSSSSLFSFGYLAQGRGATVSGFTPSGLPASPGGAWATSHLAKVALTVRSGEQAAGDTSAILQPEPPSGPNCQFALSGALAQGQAPYRATQLVSPGVWDVRTDESASDYFFAHSLAAGHSYSFTYYTAAWGVGGPSTQVHLPIVGQRAIALIAPTVTDPTGNGTLFFAQHAVTLSLNGHQIAHGSVGGLQESEEFQAGIKSAGWYTLSDTITRQAEGFTYPATVLSPRITTSWRFYATPSQAVIAPAFWATFFPHSLSPANQALPRSATSVTVTPIRSPNDPNAPVVSDTVKKLQVWASVDDGKTWHGLSVTHSSIGYSVVVTNPAGGYVSLRATVTGSHGDTSTETIYRAYAIS